MAIHHHPGGHSAEQRRAARPGRATYRQALAYLQDQPEPDWTRTSISVRYHQLGVTAQDRGRLDEASDWCRKSLTISEELGNRPGMALTYGQLGLLAEDRQQPGQALDWIVRCVTVFDQFPHPMTGPGPRHLARLTRQIGIPALEQVWRQVTGLSVPQAVRDYISHRDEDLPGGEP